MEASGHNRLAALAADIQAAHGDVQKHAEATAQRALDAGRLLIEAKGEVPHGQWEAWIAANTGLSGRTARRYMQLAQAGLETATVADLGIRAATESIARKHLVSFDLDDSDGWPMPGADERFVIDGTGPTGRIAASIELARNLSSEHRFYDFIAITDWENGPALYTDRPMRAGAVAWTMRAEGFEQSQCSCIVFRIDPLTGGDTNPFQFRKLLLDMRESDRREWMIVLDGTTRIPTVGYAE